MPELFKGRAQFIPEGPRRNSKSGLFQYEFLRNVIVDAFKHTSITFFDQNASKRVCVIKNILQIGPKCQPKGNNFRKLTGNVD